MTADARRFVGKRCYRKSGVKSCKGSLLATIGDGRRLVLRAIGLRENKPMDLIGEMRKGEYLFLFTAVVLRHCLGALASERHAERLGPLALLYVPT